MRTWINALSRFQSDTSGAVALMFGLALLPLLGVAGAALDYSRASQVRTSLSSALDSAVLRVAKANDGKLADAQATEAIKKQLQPVAIKHGLTDLRITAKIDLARPIHEACSLMERAERGRD